MNILNGIINFLNLLDEHWTEIVVIVGLSVTIGNRVVTLLHKTDAEKIELAKAQIKQVMLKMVTEAEERYCDWNQAGAIKRSVVIAQIFETYPILNKVVDQESLVQWIDDMINEALKTMRKIVAENTYSEAI